jgi:AbiV family abortive infection protein
MTNDLQLEWSPEEPFVKGCLEHTAGLIEGAKALFDKQLHHLAFHLALLALEEIGKLEVILMGRVGTEEEDAAYRKKFLDDHVGKIFWAFWGPSFISTLVDPKRFEWQQNLAASLHDKRLRGLYADPGDGDDFIAPASNISPDDAKKLIELAEDLLNLQKENKPAQLTDDAKADLLWFRAARYDDEMKKLFFSSASRQKLAEVKALGPWMKWLRERSEERQAELLALAEAETKRSVVDGDMNRPKWKFRIRVYTNSHIIKPKAIKLWNQMGTSIRWFFVDKKKSDQLIVEFDLPKAVQGSDDLYQVGLVSAYHFLLALNIGSCGFFWFDLPKQTESFDESIEDIETGALMHVGRTPLRRVELKVEPLTEWDIRRIGMAFGLLPKHPDKLGPFRLYVGGLVWWAKTDIHSGFEAQAFRAFFDALQGAMLQYGDWNGQSSFNDALKKALSPLIANVDDTVDEFIALAEKFVHNEPPPEVNIDQAAVMKLMTDVYLCAAIEREAHRRMQPDREQAEAAAAETVGPPVEGQQASSQAEQSLPTES